MNEFIIYTHDSVTYTNHNPKDNIQEPFPMYDHLRESGLDRAYILGTLECYPNNPIYEEILEEYKELEKVIYQYIEPVAAARFCTYAKENNAIILPPNKDNPTDAICCIVTIGDGLSKLSTELFASGEYIKGLIADAMADYILFTLDSLFTNQLKKICCNKHIGIKQRLEAPIDYPLTLQGEILNAVKCSALSKVSITSGSMYSPVKTMGYILLQSDTPNIYHTQHNCSNCTFTDCKWRKQNV